MAQEIEFWHFVASRLQISDVIILIVAESTGSSPGRAGYKMAVAAEGEVAGTIGGGIMEVNLVEEARTLLRRRIASATGFDNSVARELIHQKNAPNASGMICSGRQTVIVKRLRQGDAPAVRSLIASLETGNRHILTITQSALSVATPENPSASIFAFSKRSETEFTYTEELGSRLRLYIVGGGHCSLALSEMMSKLGFHISIFDDRNELNTIEKNEFADEIRIIDGYEKIADMIPTSGDTYVVVMTVGYWSDAVVIRTLADRDFKYFGVLGSKAKMAALLRELRNEGVPSEKLDQIRTPIGLPINSRTPEEIAVSIAAEIIAVKNAAC